MYLAFCFPGTAPRWSLLSRAALALLALVSIGCDGSGGGGGGGGGGPTGPQPFIALDPDSGNSPSVSMVRGGGSEGTTLVLSIEANDLENVRTIDFVLSYPGRLLRVTSVSPGDFLGVDASLVTTALDANRLQLLLTRRLGTGVSGSGQVLSLTLTGTASGTGRLDFVDPDAATPGGLVIPGIQWLGADVEVSL